MRPIVQFLGLAGVILVTLNTLPCIAAAWQGQPVAPLSSLFVMCAGLLALLGNSLLTRNTFYSVVNGLGLAGNLAIIFGVILK